jgi:hypothetical protein
MTGYGEAPGDDAVRRWAEEDKGDPGGPIEGEPKLDGQAIPEFRK